MGKLIKNHWARLVVLTAAACKSSLYNHDSNVPVLIYPRPNSCCPRSLLLAQNLLGLSHKKPRWRRQTFPHPANRQRHPRRRRSRLGMAASASRRHWTPPLHRSPLDHLPRLRALRPAPLPRHQLRPVLHRRHDCVLLGLQRGRDCVSRAMDAAEARIN
jgi:hypothetical protein